MKKQSGKRFFDRIFGDIKHKLVGPFQTNVPLYLNETICTIWYHLYNSKNVKNTHGGVLLLEKLQAKGSTPPWVFFTFFNCTNSTKSFKASQIFAIYYIN